jgi:hypothetical protein
VIVAWRYDSPIDIENDGQPRNVVAWTGRPAETLNRPCGGLPEEPGVTQPLRWRQLAFVLTSAGDELDDSRTSAIFGDPAGAARISFRAIGGDLDILKYRNQTYFDTFLDSPPSRNHLAVFVRHGGVTSKVCEYLYRGKRPMKGAKSRKSHE